MTTIYIGQLHVVVDKAEDSDFDNLYLGKDWESVLKQIQLDFSSRITETAFGANGEDSQEAVKSLYNLMHAETPSDMEQWFAEFYSYYSFHLFQQEI